MHLVRFSFTLLSVVTLLHTVSHSAARAASPAAEQIRDGWHHNFEDARQESQATGEPLLIHFQAHYCGPCRQMDSQVFSQPDVRAALQQGLVSVHIDVTQHSDVASRYGAETVPRDVVVYPDGTVETINVGFVPRTTYLSLLNQIAVRGQRMQAAIAPKTPPEPKPVITQPDARANNAYEADPPSVDNSELIGLEGFCPVQLHKQRVWVKGDPKISESHRGITYYFASEADRREFLSGKDKFAPQNLGCDPVILLASQRAETGSILHGAFFDEKLYLFHSADNKSEFKKNPLRFTQIRQAIRREEIVGTQFR